MSTTFSYPDPKLQEELKRTADAIVTPGKGILAVDETNGKINTYLPFSPPQRGTYSVRTGYRANGNLCSM